MTIREQIDAIKDKLSIIEDIDLAKLLSIRPNVISQWANRGKISKEGWFALKGLGINRKEIEGETAEPSKKSHELKTPINQNNVEFINFQIPKDTIMIPEYGSPVHAGNPAVAYNDLVGMVNATRHLHAQSYYVRVKGKSMENSKIREGTRLLVDSSIEPKNGNTVIAWVNGEYTVKVFKENGGQWLLCPDPDPDNKEEFHPIRYDDSDGSMKIIGVVVRAEQDFV